jgi:probable F420-dependent oxidoreductase
MTTPNIDLGRFGVFTWDPGSSFLDLGLAVSPEQAQEIERLGYGTLWVTGSPAAELSFAEPLLESTTALKVATGIVNIWTADAKTVAESFHRINTAHPGRFVLGIGAGHPEHTEQYRKPALRRAGRLPRRARRIRRTGQSACARRARAASAEAGR